MTATKYHAEAFDRGQWFHVAGPCESKFVASLALTRFELAGTPTRIVEEKPTETFRGLCGEYERPVN